MVRKATLAVLLLGVCLGLASGQDVFEIAGSQAGVLYRSGTVEVARKGDKSFKPCAEGEVLAPGDRIRTGPESNAALVLADQTVMKLAESTELVLVDLSEGEDGLIRKFQLTVGRVWSDVVPRTSPGSVFEIQGPDAVAAVKGTAFEVEAGEEGTDILVWEGSVGARTLADAKETMIGEGAGFQYNRFNALRGQAVRLGRFSAADADPWQKWNLENRLRLRQAVRAGRLTPERARALQQFFRSLPAPTRQRLRDKARTPRPRGGGDSRPMGRGR